MRSCAESGAGDEGDVRVGWLGNWRQAGNGVESQTVMNNRAWAALRSKLDGNLAPSNMRGCNNLCSSHPGHLGTGAEAENMWLGTLRLVTAPQLQWEARSKGLRGQPGRI